MSAQLIESVPVYDLAELDGKTLTINVYIDRDIDAQRKTTIVVGTDERGVTYVLADQQEPIVSGGYTEKELAQGKHRVHPIER